jgi:hypothetical protein
MYFTRTTAGTKVWEKNLLFPFLGWWRNLHIKGRDNIFFRSNNIRHDTKHPPPGAHISPSHFLILLNKTYL